MCGTFNLCVFSFICIASTARLLAFVQRSGFALVIVICAFSCLVGCVQGALRRYSLSFVMTCHAPRIKTGFHFTFAYFLLLLVCVHFVAVVCVATCALWWSQCVAGYALPLVFGTFVCMKGSRRIGNSPQGSFWHPWFTVFTDKLVVGVAFCRHQNVSLFIYV